MTAAPTQTSASRILIAGGPKCGKSTIAARLCDAMAGTGVLLMHTDDLMGDGFDWSAASLRVSEWFQSAAPWIIEGVSVPRALRKWFALRLDSQEKPADVVYWSLAHKVPLSKGQVSMAKGCQTVFEQVRPMLLARGVEIRAF